MTSTLVPLLLLLLLLLLAPGTSQPVPCVPTVDGCQLCLDAYNCQKCTIGYQQMFWASTRCMKCKIGQKTCQSSVTCHKGFTFDGTTCQCPLGKGANWSTRTCLKCHDPHCQTCYQAQWRCQSCQAGYGIAPGALTNSCQPCSDPNCRLCTYDYTTCLQCHTYFVVQAATATCYACPIVQCIQCSSNPGICMKCADGYGVRNTGSGDVCQLCSIMIGNCVQCQNDVTCLRCTDGWGVDLSSPNICVACNAANSMDCSANFQITKQCNPGFNLLAATGTCFPCLGSGCNCQVPNCNTCLSGRHLRCSSCDLGYGVVLSTNQCTPCLHPGCQACATDYTKCTSCTIPYSLSNNTCAFCSDSFCVQCVSNINVCTQCTFGYGLQGGSCQRCNVTDVNCLACPTDVNTCQQCQLGFGVDSGQCVPCEINNCQICSFDAKRCEYCKPGYDTNAANTSCQKCSQPRCIRCPNNNCIRCQIGYGQVNNTCQVCQDHAKCQYCPSSYLNCTTCKLPYGENSGNCVACQTGCDFCHPSAYYHCYRCLPEYFLNTTSRKCQPCPANCLTCVNGTQCQICKQGYFLDLGRCQTCPTNCTACKNDPALSSISCTACIVNYEVVLFSSADPYGICKDKCGDGLTDTHPCDLPKGTAYDGCTDDCQVQPGFQCRLVGMLTQCSWTGGLTAELVAVDRLLGENLLIMQVKISPLLDVLTDIELLTLFKIADPRLQLSRVVYLPQLKLFQFTANILSDTDLMTELPLQFTPSQSSDPRFFATQDSMPSVTNFASMFYYYSNFSLLTYRILFYLCYILIALQALAVLLSVYLRKLIGLEAAWVLQMAWVVDVTHQGFKHMQMLGLTGLTYTGGYAVQGLEVVVGVQVLGFLAMVFMYVRMRVWKPEDKFDIPRYEDRFQKPGELKKREQHYEASLQFVTFFVFFNFVRFCYSMAISVKTGFDTSTLNIAYVVVTGGLLLYLLVLFVAKPDLFGYFRYSFRYTEKSIFFELRFKHVLLCLAVLLATICLQVFLPGLPFAPLIPPGVLVVYTPIFRPYKQPIDNYRSALNFMAIFGCLSVRLYVWLIPPPYFNQPLYNILLLLTFGVLNFVVVSVAVGILLHQFITNKCVKGKNDPEDADFIAERDRAKALQMLSKANVNNPTQNPNTGNIYDRISSPKKNLLQFSNSLLNQTQRETLLSNRPLRLQYAQQTIKNNTRQHEKIKAPQTNKTQDSDLLQLQQTAIKVLADENTFVHLQYSAMRVRDQTCSPNNKNVNQFLDAYNIIEEEKERYRKMSKQYEGEI